MIRYIFQAGRFDATTHEVRVALANLRAIRGVSLVLCTEHYDNRWRDAYPPKSSNWDWVRNGEGFAMWDEDEWEFVKFRVNKLTESVWYTRRGGTMKTYRHNLWLRNRHTKKVHIFRWAHHPSHVQQGTRFRRTVRYRVVAYNGIMRAWRRLTRSTLRHQPDVVLHEGADFNLDVYNLVWRRYIKDYFPGLKFPALPKRQRRKNRQGDLGSRLVTIMLASRPQTMDVLTKQPGHDHRPVLHVMEG